MLCRGSDSYIVDLPQVDLTSFKVEYLSEQSELQGLRLQNRVVKVAKWWSGRQSLEKFMYFVPQVLNKQGKLLF